MPHIFIKTSGASGTDGNGNPVYAWKQQNQNTIGVFVDLTNGLAGTTTSTPAYMADLSANVPDGTICEAVIHYGGWLISWPIGLRSCVIHVTPGTNTIAAWNSGTAYVKGNVVSLTSMGVTTNYYCILAHTNHTPPNATYWTVASPGGMFAAYLTALVNGLWTDGAAMVSREENGATVVKPGRYTAVYEENEAGVGVWAFNGFRPLSLMNTVYAVLPATNPTGLPDEPALVEYTGSAPAYDPTLTYQAGEQVAYTNGNEYISLTYTNIGNTPSSSPSNWSNLGGTVGFGPQWIVIPAASEYSAGIITIIAQIIEGAKDFLQTVSVGTKTGATYSYVNVTDTYAAFTNYLSDVWGIGTSGVTGTVNSTGATWLLDADHVTGTDSTAVFALAAAGASGVNPGTSKWSVSNFAAYGYGTSGSNLPWRIDPTSASGTDVSGNTYSISATAATGTYSPSMGVNLTYNLTGAYLRCYSSSGAADSAFEIAGNGIGFGDNTNVLPGGVAGSPGMLFFENCGGGAGPPDSTWSITSTDGANGSASLHLIAPTTSSGDSVVLALDLGSLIGSGGGKAWPCYGALGITGVWTAGVGPVGSPTSIGPNAQAAGGLIVSAGSGLWGLADGGTGSDLSATGPGLLIQGTTGANLSVSSYLDPVYGGLGLDASAATVGTAPLISSTGTFSMLPIVSTGSGAPGGAGQKGQIYFDTTALALYFGGSWLGPYALGGSATITTPDTNVQTAPFTFAGGGSIAITGDGSATVTLALVNDATPTASQYYGTDAGSTLGYYNLPSGGSSTITTPDSNVQTSPFTFTDSNGITITGDGVSTVNIALAIPVTVPRGGSGLTTWTAHGVPIGNGTSAPNFAGPATAGDLFLAQGASADPAFYALSGDATITSGGALTVVGLQGNPVTSGTPTTGYALCWNGSAWAPAASPVGSLAIGDPVTSGTNWNVLSLDGSANLSQIAPSTAGDVLTSNGASAAATFQALPTPYAFALGSPVGSGTNYNILSIDGSANVSEISPSTGGYVLTSNGTSAAATFQALPAQPTFANSLVVSGGGGGTVTLVNDASGPGNNQSYRTNGSGTRGWMNPLAFGDPLGGSFVNFNILSLDGSANLSQIAPGVSSGYVLTSNGTATAATFQNPASLLSGLYDAAGSAAAAQAASDPAGSAAAAQSNAEAYSAGTPGNWASPPPTTNASAEDRLAAWIAANSTVFGTLGITTSP
jgi:hypothetical protein